MEQVIQQCGHFALVQTGEGFAWTMRSETGVCWYWHPQTQEWTAHPHASSSPEEATKGLDLDAPLTEEQFHHQQDHAHLRSPSEERRKEMS
jgi:hypothetical protein